MIFVQSNAESVETINEHLMYVIIWQLVHGRLKTSDLFSLHYVILVMNRKYASMMSEVLVIEIPAEVDAYIAGINSAAIRT